VRRSLRSACGSLQSAVQATFQSCRFVAVFEPFANGTVDVGDSAPIGLLGLLGVLSFKRFEEGLDTGAH